MKQACASEGLSPSVSQSNITYLAQSTRSFMLATGFWLASSGYAAFGEEASAIALAVRNSRLSESKAAEVFCYGQEATVCAKVDLTQEEVVRDRLAALARNLAQSNPRPARVTVILQDLRQSERSKAVLLTADQMKQDVQGKSLALLDAKIELETAVAPPSPTSATPTGSPAIVVPPARATAYMASRAKLVTLIQKLQARGVGVKPFNEELAKADQQLKTTESEKALQRVNAMVASLTAYSQQLDQMKATAPRRGAAKGHRQESSVADFAGDTDEYYNTVVRQIIQNELGPGMDCPKGPFRLERFRLAKRIRELEQAGHDTAGFKQQLRHVNELAVSKNRMPELRDGIRYLEQQLGLQELR